MFPHLQVDCCLVNSPVPVGTAGLVPVPTRGVCSGINPAVLAGMDPLHTPGMGEEEINNKLELVMEIFLLFIPRHWCWKLGNAVVTWR